MSDTEQDLRGRFDPAEFAEELAQASGNHQIGTSLWLQDERIRVFEVRLDPGERCAFHIHDRSYFWSVVDGGKGLQRHADGTYAVNDYRIGDTMHLHPTPEKPLIHDLENIGDSVLRFVTVEFITDTRAVGSARAT